MAFLKGHWQVLALTTLIFALWQTPVMVPLKIVVVLLHELSHGAAAILTGGTIEQISVSPQQGGFARTRGGSGFFISTAGYLGSLVLGVGLLIAALKSTADRVVMMAVGAIFVLVAALYMRDLFAFGFTAGMGAVLLASGFFLPHQFCDLGLRVIGLTSMIYVPYDIFDDTIRRASLRSDARILAEEVGGSTILWGVIWLLISGVVIFVALRSLLGRDSNVHFTSGTKAP
ncbi:M50 family metallopeptidase [Litoreibacter ponti]|uniref:M50 family metallopeptidase n=1 Tax=Litoreibacter ponti TaxID=1510457 RepID=UPI000D3210D6|nr:M50 family metallopeptidase [Litoreibacter ponti]